MKKYLIITLVIVVCVLGAFLIFNKKGVETDSQKFKKEYESLNNTIRESDKSLYNSVSIDEKNPIKYVTIDDTLDLLKDKKAIIYIGANWCPWCRNMLPVMFDVAKKLNIDTIYYLNIDDDKSNYEIKDNKLEKINDGTKSYYKLLAQLNDYLKDYKLTAADGKTYDTGEKRIYMPFFITVKNGSIVDAKSIVRTLEENQNKYSEMTKDQYNDLYNEFYETFNKINQTNQSCSLNGECN